MIALNSRQTLPPRAFWYLGCRSLIVALIVVLIATLFRMAGSSPNVACSGALCGKASAYQFAAFLYLYAAFLIVAAFLNYRTFSFVLLDKGMTIESGAFFRRSTTFRYDRIQDVDTYRGPLHLLLGLSSVAIWTSSPDQFASGVRRPDGRIVLEEEAANWLKEHLLDAQSSGAAAAAGSTRQPGASAGAGRQPVGTFAIIVFILAVLVFVIPMFRKAPVSTPATGTAAAPASAPAIVTHTAPSPFSRRTPHPHVVRQVNAAVRESPAGYALSCAIRDSVTAGNVRACANLSQGQRCAHEADFASQPTAEPAQLSLVNRSGESVKFYWLNQAGARALYASLPPGGQVQQPSHIGAHWLVSTQDGQCLGIFDAATLTIGIF